MREFTIGKNDAGQRLDRFVAKNLPLLPPALLQKYIRLKRIKVNGKGSKRDVRLETGDILQLYINDEFFDKPNEENLFLTVFKPQLNIVYEDENLLLVDKRPGMSVHADETEKVNTLINHIQAYLYQKREWNPKWENAFAPALCNRIDRNTGGIVIAAKNAETLRIINEKIRAHELEKSYLCITVGRPKQPEGKIEGFLLKNEAKKEVRFFHKPVPGGKTAVTLYRTLESRGGLSLVECRLLTGRTHQIRVSMSEIGCPLLGDGKYGKGDVNRRYHETRQALYSYKLRFDFPTDAGLLNYLKGQEFTVENVPFREKYARQNWAFSLTFQGFSAMILNCRISKKQGPPLTERRGGIFQAPTGKRVGNGLMKWGRIHVQRVDSPAGSLHGIRRRAGSRSH